jgi:hypothetical protein
MTSINGVIQPTIPQKILTLLSDGMPHPRQALMRCMNDHLADGTAMMMHVSALRKQLRAKGYDILCQQTRDGSYYRIVRHLSSPYVG